MSSVIVFPLVSVYIPTKNRGSLLKRAINSVFAQDYSNFELIIVDDGSIDDTQTILQSYQQENDNVRFYHNEKSIGAAAARNKAIEHCTGEFVTGLDDDDYFCPNRLSTLMAAYDDRYAFVCSSVIWDFGDRRNVADKKAKVFHLHQQLSYNHATTQVLVKRERMLAIGAFDVNFVARIDYDAWTRLMIVYGPALRINPPSYILNRDKQTERITSSDRNVEGNHQFDAKYRSIMNTKNLRNRAFWDMYAQNEPFGIKELFQQICAGHVLIKLKYFIRIHFFHQ